MRYLAALLGLSVLSGCYSAETNYASEDTIALKYHKLLSEADTAPQKAAAHCAKYGKSAEQVDRSETIEYVTITYRCK
jgi:hypothetical protein